MTNIIKLIVTKKAIALFAIVFVAVFSLLGNLAANKTEAATGQAAQCKQTLVDSAGNHGIKISPDGKRASVTLIVENIDKCVNKYASLSSWKVPGKDQPIVQPFDNQTFFAHSARKLVNGRQTMTVPVPQCYYQIDLFSTRQLKPAKPAPGQSNSDFLLGPNDVIANYKLGGNKSCEPEQPKEKDIAIVKDVSKESVADGEVFTYTIKVTNTGEADLTNVRVTDRLPNGIVSVDNPDSREISFTVDSLKVGQSKTFSFQAKATEEAAKNSDLTNVACVLANGLSEEECDDAVVQVPEDDQPSPEPEPETPETPDEATPEELPDTGAGAVAGIFAATSCIAGAVHFIIKKKLLLG